MADFQSNFKKLKDANVIPDVQEDMLPKAVHDVIGNLSDQEIGVLVNIGQKTGSHIYLNKEHSIVCGF
jgi:hypothetical protein